MVHCLQLMFASTPVANRTHEISEISEITRSLKTLAKECRVPIVGLRLNRLLEYRRNKRPVTSDLRASGAIEKDADVILLIFRGDVFEPTTAETGTAEIIIAKERNGPLGAVQLNSSARTPSLRICRTRSWRKYFPRDVQKLEL